MESGDMWELDGVSAAWSAAPLEGALVISHRADELVTPESVMKVPIALAAASLIESGELDGTARRRLPARGRTPGPGRSWPSS